MAHLSEKEAYEAGLIPKPKGSKLKNVKTECSNGDHLHDSGHEADYCSQLKLRQRDGEFSRFDVQVKFEVQPGFISFTGKKIRAITYIADFVIDRGNGVLEIVDAKGKRTEVFNIKWKMLQFSLRNSRKADYIFTIA